MATPPITAPGFVSQGTTGVDFTATYSAVSQTNPATPEYPGLPFYPGQRVTANNGAEWAFVTAGGTIAQYDCVFIDSTFASVKSIIGKTLAPSAGFIGFCQVSGITSGVSFWAMISGEPIINLAGSVGAAGSILYTTTTSGVLGNTTLSTSQYQVMSVLNVGTNSGSTASATQCTAIAPMIRRPAT